MRTIASMLLAAACAASLLALPATAAAPAAGVAADRTVPPRPSDWLERLRRETAKFKDPRVAERHGYRRTDSCWEFPYKLPGDERLGAMGYHYTNQRLIDDPKIELLRPEVLVYVPDGSGGRTLGAVEYFRADRDQRMATADDRPTLLGHEFQGPMGPHLDGMPIHYDLHLWIFKENPNGMFEPWNPRVRCPAGAVHSAHG
ncbi:hypothetical protein OUY22_15025 [Nonomuraea sp. MCN248]|uniref:Uncharacterized protein n=1 Tax=Nonomuraea corallina TaxID=2989783 RepID=A0ABT4SC64_9ACTN|nr:hypothetical protein [Nonomuraea corallina]MDA0634735.1 hypothetical protein [Nonomuraea corallina]